MSVQEEREYVELPNMGDAAFGALLDALAPDGTQEGAGTPPAGEAGPAGGPAASGAPGGPDAPGGGAAPAGPAAAGDGQAPADGADAAGGAGQPAAGPADGGAVQSAAASQPAAAAQTGVDAATVAPQIGELSTKFEETITKAFQHQAYEQAREDYEKYFEALEKHPRLLVGAQVPAIGKEGMETLRNSEDAKEWQEAVRSLLVAEIRDTAQVKIEESREFLNTVHASIDLFKNNPDLIPGTKGFDRGLADAFAAMAAPYEIRDEDTKKLLGYSIPVQPIIENLRKQRAAAATPAATPPLQPVPAPKPKPDPPQAGIQSKAGSSSEKEDFSTLFGTIGLPNLQI